MEARAQRGRLGDPAIPTFLTVDLTFKPANYYIYGPVADICNPDCYPISLGADATMVREVVETARLGAGPRPLTFTFQGVLEGPRDPEAFAKLRFPRAAFPGEERLMMYYAIGAGARGLWNYIHCTENSDARWSRGSNEFPEVWNEIGRVYRELDHVAPLLALAHPTQLATSGTPKLWLRTLLCGEDAALVCWANDDYQQNRDSFICKPLEGVRITLPELPWLRQPAAYLVTETGFEPLTMEGAQVVMPRMGVAGLVLLAGRQGLAAELAARYDQRQQRLADLLLAEWRRNLGVEAAKRTEGRRIAGELAAYGVAAEPLAAYGMSLAGFWNPRGDTYNVLEFGVNDNSEGPDSGARWKVSIPQERAGQVHVLFVDCGTWGKPGEVIVTGPGGAEVLRQAVTPPWDGAVQRLRFVAAEPGEYTVRFAVPGAGPKGGRAAGMLFVAPEAEAVAAGL
jgi:hypothetical protein